MGDRPQVIEFSGASNDDGKRKRLDTGHPALSVMSARTTKTCAIGEQQSALCQGI